MEEEEDPCYLLEPWIFYFDSLKTPTYNESDYRHYFIKLLYESVSHDSEEQISLYTVWGSNIGNNEDNNISFTEEERRFIALKPLDVFINYSHLYSQQDQYLQAFLDLIYTAPQEIIQCFNIVWDRINVIICNRSWKLIRAHIFYAAQPTSNYSLNALSLGRYVSVRGVVSRVNQITIVTKQMIFQCSLCLHKMRVSLSEYKFCLPLSCSNRAIECKSKNFIPHKRGATHQISRRFYIRDLGLSTLEIGGDTHDKNTDNKNYPTFTRSKMKQIQQQEEEEKKKSNNFQAQNSSEELMCESNEALLVDAVKSGEIVVVSGVLLPGQNFTPVRTKKDNAVYTSYIVVNSILRGTIHNESKVNPFDAKYATYQERAPIREKGLLEELVSKENIFHILIRSFCPTISGNDFIKAAMLLSIVTSGIKRVDNSNVRPLINIMLLGKPGLGKSELLKAASKLAVPGLYLSSSSTSTAGLTVAMIKEPGFTDYSLRAGALVLTSGGVLCLDEFDKMQPGDRDALLEAMELQQTTITKAGVLCSFEASTSIIVACNPPPDNQNSSKYSISSALRSRFDLIFLLDGKDSRITQEKVADNILEFHSVSRKRKRDRWEESEEVIAREIEQEQEILSTKILRDYIGYIQDTVPIPKLSQKAAEVIQNFYLHLRANQRPEDPVTIRKLLSLIRLSEALARIQGKKTVEAKDAEYIVEMTLASYSGWMPSQNNRINNNSNDTNQRIISRRRIVTTTTTDISSDLNVADNLKQNIQPKATKKLTVKAQKSAFIETLYSKADKNLSRKFNIKELREIAETHGISKMELSAMLEKDFANFLLLSNAALQIYELAKR